MEARNEMLFPDEFFAEEQTGGFSIRDDDTADWAVAKLAEKKEEADRLIGLAEREIARLKERIEEIKEKAEKDAAFLSACLFEYFGTVKRRETKTMAKYELLHGTLVLKRGGQKYERDDAAIMQWAKETGRADLVKIEEKLNWAELKKGIAQNGETAVDTETGEVVPGITITQAPDTFSIDYAKKEKEAPPV